MLKKILKRLKVSSFNKASLFLLLGIFLFQQFKANAEISAAAGQKIYKQYCTSCHKINGELVGPALKDVHKRRSEEWLIKWIRNNAELRKSGDKDAIAVWEKYAKNEMPSFTNLTDDDVKSIIAYIVQESEGGGAQAGGTGTAGAGTDGAQTGAGSDYKPMLYIFLIVFLAISFFLSRIISNLRRLSQARNNEPVTEPKSFVQVLRQKNTIAVILLILIAILGYTTVEKAQKLGRSKGYAPEQPIKFSHKIHAGTNQINCLYCHASAEKSKAASIPSVNVCMNCHKAVQEGRSPEGTAEIAKITAAYNNNTPIKWVKIHNTPDHVYFNHAQHVKAGKIECQKCHGPVETMEKVEQFSSLSMGWCINCHRETEVQFASNNYYSQFEKLHEDVKSGKIKAVTEGMLGGTECQKCHY
jgi:mono/diheme cytochrome c family protein